MPSLNSSDANVEASPGKSLEQRILLLFIYVPSILLCVVGNSLAIIVFMRGHRSRSDIRNFFVCLSTADLLVGIFCQPFTFLQLYTDVWLLPFWFCPIALYFQLLSVSVSVATNMVIGLDRLWMILVPLRSRFTKSRSTLVIVVIWCVSGLLSSVQLFVGRTQQLENSTEFVCAEEWPKGFTSVYTVIVAVLTYVLPLAVLSATYAVVGVKVWHRKPPGVINSRQALKHLTDKRKTIKMLVVIVFLFGVCWLPLHLFFINLDFVFVNLNKDIESYIYIVSHWLAMANSFVNPIIYGFMNKSFREDLAYLFRSCLFPEPAPSDQRTYSYGTGRRSRAQIYRSMVPSVRGEPEATL